MHEVLQETVKCKLDGVVLTCKENMIPFYEQFGFVDEGVSESEHGGVVWHQMRIRRRDIKRDYSSCGRRTGISAGTICDIKL